VSTAGPARIGQPWRVTGSPGPTFSVVDAGSPESRLALERYVGELEERFPTGFDGRQALDEAGAAFNEPSGRFVVAKLDDEIVGCGALLWLDQDTAEIKRMWVDRQRRGIGLGRRLLTHLEGEASRAGRSRVVLDTNAALTEAIAMYRASGYVAIERYNENPSAHHWFAKQLTPTGSGRP
jgi:GNAT superfamily N-acetyltransferase